MIFSEKLLLIRKNKGYSQEELAEVLDVSRQAIAKWESGQSYPEIHNLIAISSLFNVTVDYLVKDNDDCMLIPFETNSNFSGDFLKAALKEVPYDKPYRGPAYFHDGDYTYICKVDGTFEWYQGYEEILYHGARIYECYFHGGKIK